MPNVSLSPLFQLHQLRHLKTDVAFVATGEIILRIARAFTHLVTLLLPAEGDLNDNPPTLETLCSISRFCPQLEELQLPIHIIEFPPATQPQTHVLKKLTVYSNYYNWSIDRMVEASQFLYAIFPRAWVTGYGCNVGLHAFGRTNNDAHRQWEEVQKLILAYQHARTAYIPIPGGARDSEKLIHPGILERPRSIDRYSAGTWSKEGTPAPLRSPSPTITSGVNTWFKEEASIPPIALVENMWYNDGTPIPPRPSSSIITQV